MEYGIGRSSLLLATTVAMAISYVDNVFFNGLENSEQAKQIIPNTTLPFH
jgi:hypothetical protein